MRQLSSRTGVMSGHVPAIHTNGSATNPSDDNNSREQYKQAVSPIPKLKATTVWSLSRLISMIMLPEGEKGILTH